MSDLLLMASSGLPRNGLVALYDPYRDAYGLDAAGRAALQTGTDYSGHGNTLTYGATTGASTDDPTNTGTAWSFDGGDFLATPDLGNGDITAYTVFKTPASVGGIIGLWARNNVGLQITADPKVALLYRNGAGSQPVYANMSLSTWYLASVRATTAGYIALSLSGIGTLANSGFGAINASFTTYGDYLGREYEYFHTSDIAFHAVYNWVHPDNLAMRCRNSIKSLMAPRGIAL